MSEIRCPKCDSDKTEISNFRMGQTELRYCRECYVYWTDWQQSAIASRDATIKELQEENANNYGLHKIVNKCGMHLFPLMPDPELGQNVAVIAGYIDIYRTRIEKLENEITDAKAFVFNMTFPRTEDDLKDTLDERLSILYERNKKVRARIEKLEKGLRELRNEAYGMLSAFPEVADVISNTNYNVLMRKVEAASAALEEGKE